MENYIINSRCVQRIVFLFSLSLLTLVWNSCQEVSSPNTEIQSVKIGVQVTDLEGNPLSGITVNYKEGRSIALANLGSFGIGTTPSGVPPVLGIITSTFNLPISGKFYTFSLGVPASYKLLPTANLYYSSVFFPCHDSLIVFKLPVVIDVPCNQTLNPIVMKTLMLCQNEKQFDTVCTNSFSINCTTDNEITVPNLSTIPGAKIIIHKSNGKDVTSPFILSPGQGFSVCMAYDNGKSSQPFKTETISIKAKPVGGTQYNLVDVTFSAESKCQDCVCPTTDFIVDFPFKGEQLLCIHDTSTFTIDLKGITNTNKNCLMRFVPEKGLNSSQISILSFNDNSLELEPNGTLSSLKVRANSSTFSKINEELVYGIILVNKSDLSETVCTTKLRIRLNFNTEGATCGFDTKSDVFVQPFTSDQNTQTFYSGIDIQFTPNKTNVKTVTVRNLSTTCPLNVTNIYFEDILTGVVKTSPFRSSFVKIPPVPFVPFVIPASSSQIIDIEFFPTVEDVFPSNGKRTNPRIDNFKQNIVITTSSPNCNLAKVPLNGEIISTGIISPCMGDWDIDQGKNGIFVNPDGSINQRSDARKDFAMFFDKVDAVAGTARLNKGFPNGNTSLKYVDFYDAGTFSFTSTAQTACDLAKNVSGNCDAVNPLLDNIPVAPGRMFLVKYSYGGSEFCAVLCITDIKLLSTQFGGVPSVCYTICAGI